MNIYYEPAGFNCETVGEIDWSDGCYQFDLTVVWKRTDGVFVYAEDSGCSCPAPFDYTTPAELVVLPKRGGLATFKAHCEARNADNPYGGGDRAVEIAALLERMRAAGAR